MARKQSLWAVEEVLAETGLPWEIVTGGHHRKVRLDGRLVAVLPISPSKDHDRAQKNVVSQIRRAAKESKSRV